MLTVLINLQSLLIRVHVFVHFSLDYISSIILKNM